VKLLAVWERERQGHPPMLQASWKIFLRCELEGGAPDPHNMETDAVDWFGEEELPPLSLLRITPGEMKRMFEHYRNPGWPADFD
jgi:hypothetical protein